MAYSLEVAQVSRWLKQPAYFRKVESLPDVLGYGQTIKSLGCHESQTSHTAMERKLGSSSITQGEKHRLTKCFQMLLLALCLFLKGGVEHDSPIGSRVR